METRQLTLKPKDRKPADLGPVVRVESARLLAGAAESRLEPVFDGSGLAERDTDGLFEHGTDPATMWLADSAPGLALEFNLPEKVPLAALEVWNYNREWHTADGLRKAGISVSSDGITWERGLSGFEFDEAEGGSDYDQPVVVNLKGVEARKVRFENLVPWKSGGKLGLSEVVFHQAPGSWAAPVLPHDGARNVALKKTRLRWTAVPGAVSYTILSGPAPDQLTVLGTTAETSMALPGLQPDQTRFWRADARLNDGKEVSGRLARFTSAGLAGWWKLDETQGFLAADARHAGAAAKVRGKPNWVAEGRLAGALEFDGRSTLVECASDPAYETRETVALSLWVKVRRFDKGSEVIACKGGGAWRLHRYEYTDQLAFSCPGLDAGKGRQPIIVSRKSVNDGQWHHAAGTYDGDTLALYIDGELQGSLPATGQLPADAGPLRLGCDGGGNSRFNGWIDDVRLFGYALEPSQVKDLFRGEFRTAQR